MRAQDSNDGGKHATIYRIVSPDHVCPFGEAAVGLLRNVGYEVDDHWLTSRPEIDAYMARLGVRTTPQIFIDGERIGGYDELSARFDSARGS
jgi:glutaredoxin